MEASSTDYHPPQKMAIITSYFKGETYGLLGPQMAATIIEDHGGCKCIVIAVTREDDKTTLKQHWRIIFQPRGLSSAFQP